MEGAIYDSCAMRTFLGVNFLDEQAPDATTLLKFRHLLEKHHIGEKIFQDVSDRLEKAEFIMHGGSIVDATIIAALSSTKIKEGRRDPEMHQTKKGNQWYHGMKVHAGVDAEAVMSTRLPEQPPMSTISKKRSGFSAKTMKSVTGIPDTAEWKSGRKSKTMSLSERLNFGRSDECQAIPS